MQSPCLRFEEIEDPPGDINITILHAMFYGCQYVVCRPLIQGFLNQSVPLQEDEILNLTPFLNSFFTAATQSAKAFQGIAKKGLHPTVTGIWTIFEM